MFLKRHQAVFWMVATLLCLQHLTITPLLAQVPLIEWQKSLGGLGDDQATSIQQTSDGGYIVAGYSFSNDGDVTGHHGGAHYDSADYWIVKLSSTGLVQ